MSALHYSPKVWNDEWFLSLSKSCKLALLWFWGHRTKNIPNPYEMSAEDWDSLCATMGCSYSDAVKIINELIESEAGVKHE